MKVLHPFGADAGIPLSSARNFFDENSSFAELAVFAEANDDLVTFFPELLAEDINLELLKYLS